jgi:hypothetical protein
MRSLLETDSVSEFLIDRGDSCLSTLPDPRPAELDHHQRAAYLELIHRGLGRMTACVELGVGPSALDRTFERNPGFRRAVACIERMRTEHLCSLLYAQALRGDTAAAIFLAERFEREVNSGEREPVMTG